MDADTFLQTHYPGVELSATDTATIYTYDADRSLCIHRIISPIECQILVLVVHPDHRSSGVGSNIVKHLQRQYGVITANVLLDSTITRTLKFWQQNNFKPVEIVGMGTSSMAWGMKWQQPPESNNK